MDEGERAGPAIGFSPSDDRLDSWKEIAAYLKRDVTTVQRWERREGMPVRRHLHDRSSSVYAFRADLDAWARSRNQHRDEGEEEIVTLRDTARGFGDGRPAKGAVPAVVALRPTRPRPRHRHAIAWALAAGACALGLAWLWGRSFDSWSDPLRDARIQLVTDFEGTERAAAISRDGRFVAFLSDRDGRTDVWITQLGTGQFYNLTRGSVQGLTNPSVRTIGFTPDGTLVTFWTRGPDGHISIKAVPTMGGPPRPYLEGAVECDWSSDGSRLVYHTPGPGDPTFVTGPDRAQGRALFAAPSGLHAHFQTWSRDGRFIYFVQGAVAEAMDVWRIGPNGGPAERITTHRSWVSHPVMLDSRTLLYLATDPEGAGPWLYGMDTERRNTHRLSTGLDTYASLSASGDGRRLVATLARTKGSFWRVALPDGAAGASMPVRISLTTGPGQSPRLGPGYLLYVSSGAESDTIWRLEEAGASQVWTAPGTRILGSPAVSPDGRRVAFSARQEGKARLHLMNSDGSDAQIVTAALDLDGTPAWGPDGRSLAVSARQEGIPRLFRVALEGRVIVPLGRDYAVDPAWSPDGRFIVYSGPDIGTTFRVKAVSPTGAPYQLPELALTRGARSLRFLGGGPALVVLRGEIEHKNLWLVDLDTGAQRQLTDLPASFHVRDFDLSPDGRQVVLDRVEQRSDIVLIDRSGR